jgi:hypothetical protein
LKVEGHGGSSVDSAVQDALWGEKDVVISQGVEEVGAEGRPLVRVCVVPELCRVPHFELRAWVAEGRLEPVLREVVLNEQEPLPNLEHAQVLILKILRLVPVPRDDHRRDRL